MPFIATLLEKTVALQLMEALKDNHIYEKIQSCFRKHNRTETALVRVAKYLLRTADSGDFSVLILLDLSAAFDPTDHNILISRLQHWVGLSGTVLE